MKRGSEDGRGRGGGRGRKRGGEVGRDGALKTD